MPKLKDKRGASHGSQLNQSLIDGIEVLQALAVNEKAFGSRELARYLDLDVNRTSRLLRTLAYLGLARQTHNKKYTTGPNMHALAAQSLFASHAISNAIGSLESLMHLELIVAYGVLWRDKVTYLYHALPGMSSSEALGRLGHYPATESSIGLCLLSQLNNEEISNIYNNIDIPGFKSINSLLTEVENIRTQKYAALIKSNKQNSSSGDVSLAVWVGDTPYAGIALSGKIEKGNISKYIELLRGKASEIELKNQLHKA